MASNKAVKKPVVSASSIYASVVHDHFAGSSNCMECSGPCRLSGAALAYTEMVRALLDLECVNSARMPQALEYVLIKHGVRVDSMRSRALASYLLAIGAKRA